MKYKYVHIFSFVAALLMLATFSACEADDKIVFVTGTDIDKEESELIDVTDNSDADWNTLPAKYVVSATHTKGCSMDGLKSVKVYCDQKYLNILVEVNLEIVTDLGCTPFHIFLNVDGSAATGGYGDIFADADIDLMLETAVYQSGKVAYNPAVFKWWGDVGENGWMWTDPKNPGTAENGWGAVIPEGSSPAVGYAQQVNGDLSKIEIQIVKERVPAQWANEFTIGFDIQQNWTSVGVLPNAADDPITGARVLANKLKVKVNTSESSTDTPKENIPVVVTSAITQITETSAVAGGNVTSDGGASVTERGVVYSTNPNPVITNLNNTIRPCGSGIGEFTYTITGLQPNTTYYVRAYAKNDVGTAYGEEVSFTTKVEVVDNPSSNLRAMPFSVSESKQVYFSKGNLQYHPANDEWRFAESQLDYIGGANSNCSSTYNGWLDLFGWSTSATHFGVSTSTSNSDYSGSFVDWGTNMIGNDAPNTWRTLTNDEWRYLRYTRANANDLCGVAQVNGVNGLIFLPDNWTCPAGVTFKSGFHSNNGFDYYYAAYQTFTAEQWSKLESAGAVFLPASGFRKGSLVVVVQKEGVYWSATKSASDYAYYFDFHSDVAGMGSYNRYNGQSVRLVKDL